MFCEAHSILFCKEKSITITLPHLDHYHTFKASIGVFILRNSSFFSINFIIIAIYIIYIANNNNVRCNFPRSIDHAHSSIYSCDLNRKTKQKSDCYGHGQGEKYQKTKNVILSSFIFIVLLYTFLLFVNIRRKPFNVHG